MSAQLQVRITGEAAEYTLLAGESLDFTHQGQPVALTRAAPGARIPMETQA